MVTPGPTIDSVPRKRKRETRPLDSLIQQHAGVDEGRGTDRRGREPLPYVAGFAAGKAFVRYRRGGGDKRSPTPDFYIGAHAAVAGYRLLTRDVRRYRTYFPAIDIIAPASSEDETDG